MSKHAGAISEDGEPAIGAARRVGDQCTAGIGIWQWASNDQGVAPDVVMACCGDVPTLETLAAVSLMRQHLLT